MARTTHRTGTRNLALLDAATRDMSLEEERSLISFLIGWASGFVPEAEWARAIAAGVKR